MKKLSILAITILALVLNACTTDDEFTFVAKPDPEGLAFTNTFMDSYILKPANAENLAERFVWNEVDMDVQTTVRYELQAAVSEAFESITVLGSDIAETNYAVTVAQMMALAGEAGLDNDPATEASNKGPVYLRVRAYTGESNPSNVEQFSVPVAIELELAEDTGGEIELPKLYIAGSFQETSGYGDTEWKPENGVPLSASAIGKTDFEGFVYMNDAAPQFKFLPQNDGSWDGNFGDAGDTGGVYTGVLKLDGVNAGTPNGTGGYYLVKVDTDALTYSLDPFSWGLIGDATPTGWDADTDMTYDTDAHVWTITMNLIGGNKIKFRANDDWAVNVGDNDGDGTAEFAGSDIVVPEDGEYTITLDLTDSRNPEYTLTLN